MKDKITAMSQWERRKKQNFKSEEIILEVANSIIKKSLGS